MFGFLQFIANPDPLPILFSRNCRVRSFAVSQKWNRSLSVTQLVTKKSIFNFFG